MVNDFLQPRRHVLLEPEIDLYGKLLTPLVKSKPCYELVGMPLENMNEWEEIFKTHLPEQIPPSGQDLGALPKNDTLLVMAAPPAQRNVRNHFTPGRWWGAVMENCLLQKQFHRYGSVRVLLSVPPTDADDILPRTSFDRKRPAIMTENVALRAWEVASSYDHQQWMNRKPLSLLDWNGERVAERVAAQNIDTPAGREPPALLLAPPSLEDASLITRKRRLDCPYVPRVRRDWHATVFSSVRNAEDTSAASAQKKKAKAVTLRTLKRENDEAYICDYLAKMQMDIDQHTQSLSRAAADRRRTPHELAVFDSDLAQLKANFASALSGEHYRYTRYVTREIDDRRIAHESDEFDKSLLLWERRPFEPLRVLPDEQYPGQQRTIIYFEADANPYAVPKLQGMSEDKRSEMMRLLDTMTLTFSNHNQLSADELIRALLPDYSTNDILKAIPSLAIYAGKRLKPGCGAMPLEDPTLDPAKCFQENIDYDLSDVRMRRLPVSVMWDILFACSERSKNLSTAQFGRLLGSTTTTSRTGKTDVWKRK